MVDVAQLVEPRIVIPAVAGSSPVVHPTLSGWVRVCFVGCRVYGPLAQLVEQLTLNQLVVGSIPTRPTNLAFTFNTLRALRQSSKTSAVPFNDSCAIQLTSLYASMHIPANMATQIPTV